jgi:hypothetical protein
MYVAGYLIVTLHHSQFGIVEFSPIRPRIFSAGALFLLLLAVPFLAVSRVFHFFGLQDPKAAVSRTLFRVAPENARYLRLSIAFDFYFVCYGLSIPSLFLFPSGYLEFLELGPWGWGFFLAAAILSVLANLAQRKRFDLRPLSSTVLSLLCAVALVLQAFLYCGRSFFWLSAWYYFVGVATVLVHDIFGTADKVKIFEWERIIPSALAAVLAFATGIYGRVSPSFGGGGPTPAVFQLTAETPISSSRSVQVLLIDENDYGYYVERKGGSKTAYFLRRDLVSSISFTKE